MDWSGLIRKWISKVDGKMDSSLLVVFSSNDFISSYTPQSVYEKMKKLKYYLNGGKTQLMRSGLAAI